LARRVHKLIVISLLTVVVATPTCAKNLVQVYRDALLNDQQFKEATGTWNAQREQLQIANAAMLPTFSLTGSFTRQYNEDDPLIETDTNPQGWNWSRIYALNLSQPIFNLQFWRAIEGARAQVKAAAATYAFSAQDLMFRTGAAYLNIMKAYDTLRFTMANKMAVQEQLDTARQQFAVGLIAITGVYEAQSSYDQTVAAEIANKNELDARIEDLRLITGHYYKKLITIKEQVPLIAPVPNNIDRWSEVAGKQNFNLQAQYFIAMQQRQLIRQFSSQRYPTVNAIASYSSTKAVPTGNRPSVQFDNGQIGAEFAWVPFQGGAITAQTRQAMYNYLAASAKLDLVHREVFAQTRQSFFSVVAGISQIRADRQVVIASRNAFEATRAGYDVGTRTMVDVLLGLTTLYRAEQKYFNDQYDYLISTLQLKLNAGTLSADDLVKINKMFARVVKVPETMKKYRRLIIGETDIKATPSAIGGISIPDLPSREPMRGRIRLPSSPSINRLSPTMRQQIAPKVGEGEDKPLPKDDKNRDISPGTIREPEPMPKGSAPRAPQDGQGKSKLEIELEQRRKQILDRLKSIQPRKPGAPDQQSPQSSIHRKDPAREHWSASKSPAVNSHLAFPDPALSAEHPDNAVVTHWSAPRAAMPLPAPAASVEKADGQATAQLPAPTATGAVELPAPQAAIEQMDLTLPSPEAISSQ